MSKDTPTKDQTQHAAGSPSDAPDCSPVPEATDVEMAFPSQHEKLLPKWEDLTDEERSNSTVFCKAAQSLFFNGGKLEDFGVRIREGIEPTKVYRYLRATLPDWGPSHEHKVGGVGHMLAKWCEPV